MKKGWNHFLNQTLAAEISTQTKYYDRVIQWKARHDDNGYLFEQVQCKDKSLLSEHQELPDLSSESALRTAILIKGNFNHHFDIQQLLVSLKEKMSRTSRIIAVTYNPFLSFVYRWANSMGIRSGELPTTFITRTDLDNVCKLSGFEMVRMRNVAYSPWTFFGLGALINQIMPAIPFLRWFSFTNVITLRPVLASQPQKLPSLSIVIPARNEKGNIENALKRMPDLGAKIEIIFVEGNSTDDTWGEIKRVAQVYKDRFDIKTFQQTGKGKGDAVRLGFSKASGDLLTILDADLTMPPELLKRFYDAYTQGLADFVNGTRLVYPMEGDAMRFLNRLGNIFFAKALSYVLDARLGDSLCGTKLVTRADYDRFIAWRNDFGDFDPFGDFELLFPAAILGLGIIDIPIRYRARTYGTTNISRFRHGFMLLKMTLVGLFRIKFGKYPTYSSQNSASLQSTKY